MCGARTYMLVQWVRTCIRICNTVREGMPLPEPLSPFPLCPPNVCVRRLRMCLCSAYALAYVCTIPWGKDGMPLPSAPLPLSSFALLMCGARTYVLVQCVRACIRIHNTVREGGRAPPQSTSLPFPSLPPNVWGAYVCAWAWFLVYICTYSVILFFCPLLFSFSFYSFGACLCFFVLISFNKIVHIKRIVPTLHVKPWA